MTKITELPLTGTVAPTDMLAVVTNPGTTPVTQRVAVSDLTVTAVATATATAMQRASNLSDLASPATARTNLGLGAVATLAVGTTTGTVAAGDDARFSYVVALDSRAFGVKGDGATDDTVALQAAIDYQNTNWAVGGPMKAVIVPDNTVITNIVLKSGVLLLGAGGARPGTFLPRLVAKRTGSSTTRMITSSGAINNAGVTSLRIVGRGQYENSTGIYLDTGSCVFSNLFFEECGFQALRINGVADIVDNIVAIQCSRVPKSVPTGTVDFAGSDAFINNLIEIGAARGTVGSGKTTVSSAVTFTTGTPGFVNWTSHGMASADIPVIFTTTGTLPAGLAPNAVYYTGTNTANSFSVKASRFGTNLALTDAGTGTHTAYLSEATGGTDVLTSVAILLRGSGTQLSNAVAEFADIGVYFASTAENNSILNVRADNCPGHGFLIDGNRNKLVSCWSHRNGHSLNSTYDGFQGFGTSAQLTNCRNTGQTDANQVRYGFCDNSSSGYDKVANNYVNCVSDEQRTASHGNLVDGRRGSFSGGLANYPYVSGATPDVGNCASITLNNAGATNVTNFTAGVVNQRLAITAVNSNSTITVGATIATVSGTNIAMTTNMIVDFVLTGGGVWRQVA